MSKDLEKKSFVMYADYEETVAELTRSEQGLLMANIFHYVNEAALEPMPRTVRIVFNIIRRQIDRDSEKYTETVERNRKNGQKGGRPSKANDKSGGSTPPPTNQNPQNPSGLLSTAPKPKKADNENHNDNDSEHDTVRVNDTKAQQAHPHPNHTNLLDAQGNPKKQYAQYVCLSEQEHCALAKRYGADVTSRLIEIVSDHKGMRPNQYENYNDYYAIKSWGYERYCKEQKIKPPVEQTESSYDRDDLESYWNSMGPHKGLRAHSADS